MSLSRYRTILLLLFVLCLGGVWALSVYLQPLDGDLTRTGGFTENDFHWRNPQATFQSNLFTVTDRLEDYDRYYDIVLLGDSFSCDQLNRFFGWQNYFLQRTGFSMIVFDTRRYWPQEILNAPAFQKYPPKFFIFETVERYLYERMAYFVKVPVPESTASAIAPPTIPVPAPIPILDMQLRKEVSSFDTDYVIGYLGAVMQRTLHLNNQVFSFSLNDPGLFSSVKNQELLVYFDEMNKKKLKEADVEQLRAGIAQCTKIVESNGKTRFICLVAPDKSSIYAPYLADAKNATWNLIERVAQDKTLPVVRTDQVLAAEIARHTPDVYLPNDSHWGSIGHRLVAEALLDTMLSKNWVQTPSEKR